MENNQVGLHAQEANAEDKKSNRNKTQQINLKINPQSRSWREKENKYVSCCGFQHPNKKEEQDMAYDPTP